MTARPVVVVGAGIVGLSTARALAGIVGPQRLLVFEKEPHLAAHQSGRNSGVIHSGVYYPPGSLKARLVRAGRQPLLDLCRTHSIPVRISGKVIVASGDHELATLDLLRRRGVEQGLRVQALDRAGLRRFEPHAEGVAALHVPEAGVTDYAAVVHALAAELTAQGAHIELSRPVRGVTGTSDGAIVSTDRGDVQAAYAVVCAGLQSDRDGLAPAGGGSARIVAFRGEYRTLTAAAAPLVRSLIYPVPDPRLPFLGVHLTRGVDDTVHAGPNAIIALAREGYRWRDVEPATLLELATYAGTRRLVRRYWRTGLHELYRSVTPRAFLHDARRLVPDLPAAAFVRAPAGVRAQALRADGTLIDDFVFDEQPHVLRVVNAPSPAATASLAIGLHVADRARSHLPHLT